MTDRVTGFSKGFGFVRYATVEDAAKGVEGMDGKVGLLNFFCLILKKCYCLQCLLLSISGHSAAWLIIRSSQYVMGVTSPSPLDTVLNIHFLLRMIL